MNLAKLILKRKKAVSPVIATILLIALTVTAAAIVYFVVVPLLQKKPQLTILESPTAVVGETDAVEFTIGNIGSAAATIVYTNIKLYDENDTQLAINVTDDTGVPITENIQVAVNAEVTIRLVLDTGDFLAGKSYTIKVPGLSDIDFTY
jgi:flagellin-like protein